MRISYSTQRCLVYDDFLDPADFTAIQRFAASLSYDRAGIGLQRHAHHAARGRTAWREHDGLSLHSECWHQSQRPLADPLERLAEQLSALIAKHQELFGRAGEQWSEISYRFSQYAPGQRLSWHNDGSYVGAYSYYIHPVWKRDWGGELLVANPVDARSTELAPEIRRSTTEDEWVERMHRHAGGGAFVSPWPNRLMLLTGNTEHCIARVDPASGGVRTSVSGFVRLARRPVARDGWIFIDTTEDATS
jgi:Rps23 Pro-64 3,4-dihydroxylase Tpa1-like proline 4-hydroxylase